MNKMHSTPLLENTCSRRYSGVTKRWFEALQLPLLESSSLPVRCSTRNTFSVASLIRASFLPRFLQETDQTDGAELHKAWTPAGNILFTKDIFHDIIEREERQVTVLEASSVVLE